MEQLEIHKMIEEQREYFNSGATQSYEFRRDSLIRLKNVLLQNKQKIFDAFVMDFNKGEFDVISTELGMAIEEIDYLLKHLKSLMKPKAVKTSLINYRSKGKIYKEPYGVTLIISPWNYPLQLSIVPLAGAIAAGNTVVLKPSSYTPHVSDVLKDILSVFNEKLISVVLGGRQQIGFLLDERFDYIFFTGSPTVGHLVMEKASVHLTPVSLELGGKSPTIVDFDADIELAAKRIVWGKFLNAGQTCVAPDYVIVHEDLHDAFVERCKKVISKFYYVDNTISKDFPHVISEKHLARITNLITEKKIVKGGTIEGRLVEPIILDNVTWNDNVMKEEIFGPILPIMTFDSLDKLIVEQKQLEKPLALYYFGNTKSRQEKVITSISSGGACINDTIMHVTENNLPFGGVGNSGMGSYHGYKTFQTFTHEKSVLIKGKKEIKTKYPPYTKKKLKVISKFLKIK